jgi:lysine-specific demethylase 3
LVDEAEKLVEKYKHYKPMIADKTHKNLHSCLNRKAASREESSDNDIYCPKGKNVHPKDLQHFQWHWRKGEPVIVGNVLGGASNSLWEPSDMSSAICLKHKKVKVIDCLSLTEVCAISQSKH